MKYRCPFQLDELEFWARKSHADTTQLWEERACLLAGRTCPSDLVLVVPEELKPIRACLPSVSHPRITKQCIEGGTLCDTYLPTNASRDTQVGM